MAAGDGQKQGMPATMIADDDDLFEIDIDLLGRRDNTNIDHHGSHLRRSSQYCVDDSTEDDDGRGHALLANCLLPISSVSSAVPVAEAGSFVSPSSYPYSGYYGSSRRLFTGGSSKRFLFGRSARYCFSSRGFETMGNYFQRY